MRMGTVTGSVWATKKSPGLRGQPLLLVRMEGQMILKGLRNCCMRKCSMLNGSLRMKDIVKRAIMAGSGLWMNGGGQ